MQTKTFNLKRSKIAQYAPLVAAQYRTHGIPAPMFECVRLMHGVLNSIVQATATAKAAATDGLTGEAEIATAQAAVDAEVVEFTVGLLKLRQRPARWSGEQVDKLWFLFIDHEKWG